MCMFNTPNYYLHVTWILVYNISNNDTVSHTDMAMASSLNI